MISRIADLASQAMELPPSERAELAQRLWLSLDESAQRALPDDEAAIHAEAMRRDTELSGGLVQPRSHDEVMQAARDAIR